MVQWTVGRKSRRAHDEPFRIGVSAPDLSRLACDVLRRAGRQHRRDHPGTKAIAFT
jgi:hypothetical protein